LLGAIERKEDAHVFDALNSIAIGEINDLNSFEQRVVNFLLQRFRAEEAAKSEEKTRAAMAAGRPKVAIAQAQRLLQFVDGRGRNAAQAQYWLAQLYSETKQYAALIPVVDALELSEDNKIVLEEIAYWKAQALLATGQKKEALKILQRIAKRGGQYAVRAKNLLAEQSSMALGKLRGVDALPQHYLPQRG